MSFYEYFTIDYWHDIFLLIMLIFLSIFFCFKTFSILEKL